MVTSAPLASRCAIHASTPASLPCERCGTFCCPDCLHRRADGRQLCHACWESWRFEPLPWDVSLSPLALLRTVGAWLLRPRRSAGLYAPGGSRQRALLFAALSLGLLLLSAHALDGLAQAWASVWSGSVPAPVQFTVDLSGWLLHRFPWLLLLPALTLALDGVLLRTRAPKGALLRAWAFGLAPLWTAWIPVGLCWAGPLVLRAYPQAPTSSLITLSLSLPLWMLLMGVQWLVWRWWLLQWGAGRSARVKAVALVSPWVVLLLVAGMGVL